MAKRKIMVWALAALAGVASTVVGADAQSVGLTPPNVGVTLSSPFISPNGDGRFERTTIRVTVDEPVDLTVHLRNPVGVGTATLAEHLATGAGTSAFVWNGRLQRPSGTWVHAPDGPVTVDIDAVDVEGDAVTVHRTLTVDTRPPVVNLGGVTPEPWSGHGTISFGFTTRDPSRPLTMWAQVLDGDRVVDEMTHRRRPPDTRALTWLPEAGHRTIDPGGYDAVVTVRDAAGNTTHSTRRSFRVHRSVTTRVIHHVDGAGPRIGLTIDDCADESAWRSMLDTLDRMDAGATFFCNGDYVRRWPGLARRTAGTERVSIGSHSTDHADLTTVGYSGALARLLGDENAWWESARTTPVPWFRPPYGEYNSTVLAAAGAASFPFTVLWDIDTRDWDAGGTADILQHLGKAESGSIILIHVKDLTAQALPAIINGLRARGLEPVGMPELTH